MKTGGEKHDSYVADIGWDEVTPYELYMSEKNANRARRIEKKRRIISYKRRARRFAKSITRFFKSGKEL